MAAIEAEGLVEVYRTRKHEVRGLDGVDLEVEEATVLGPLGPNGRRQDHDRSALAPWPLSYRCVATDKRAYGGGCLGRRTPTAIAASMAGFGPVE